MSIPNEAVEAGALALDKFWGGRYAPHAIEELSDEVRAILEAAAPYIRAQVVSKVAEDVKPYANGAALTFLRGAAAGYARQGK